MSDIISRGMALLAQAHGSSDTESEMESPANDASEGDDGEEVALLQQLVALTQLMIDRVDALERAMCAPRERIPVRDMTGRIISVTDCIIEEPGPDDESTDDYE